MKCFNCGESNEYFYVEHIPCECGDTVEVVNYVCKECMALYKVIDGKVYTQENLQVEVNPNVQSFFHMADIDIGDELYRIVEDILGDELAEGQEENSMFDHVHRCIKCHAVAYESGPSSYKCSNCEFEWEVR